MKRYMEVVGGARGGAIVENSLPGDHPAGLLLPCGRPGPAAPDGHCHQWLRQQAREGLRSRPRQKRGWIGHTGEVPGYNTTLYYNPELKTTVVEVKSDISSGDCPPDVPTMSDDPHDIACAEPASGIVGALAEELGNPFATDQ